LILPAPYARLKD